VGIDSRKAWIAQQERIRLSERTKAGLEKARKQGRIGGRPRVVVDRDRLAQLDEEGWTTREIGEEFGISSASVSRLLQRHQRLQNPAAGL
jgi:DNA invertase Pin-like site-specific DNA recombinase